jgi:hypothetical protein
MARRGFTSGYLSPKLDSLDASIRQHLKEQVPWISEGFFERIEILDRTWLRFAWKSVHLLYPDLVITDPGRLAGKCLPFLVSASKPPQLQEEGSSSCFRQETMLVELVDM